MKKAIVFFITFILILCCFIISITAAFNITNSETETEPQPINPTASQTKQFDINSIPQWNETDAYYIVNNNEPFFTDNDYKTSTFEYYADLDELNRCGTCYVCLDKNSLPNEERGSINNIKPSGWKNKKYDFIDNGGYVYNRCHLIAHQLTGQNANKKNLITGTRYLNVTGMLPFENKVADAVKTSNNHILYRVTPIFEDNNLVANGVLMEGYSVEDKGKSLCFNVYCYNVQPGVNINYATGETTAK